MALLESLNITFKKTLINIILEEIRKKTNFGLSK